MVVVRYHFNISSALNANFTDVDFVCTDTSTDEIHTGFYLELGMGSYFDESKGDSVGSGTLSAAKCAFAFCKPQ